jgi:hypothetical protein
MDKLYRYEDAIYSGGVDEWDNPLPGYVRVKLVELEVVKVTPKGVWINRARCKKFVLLTARKRYAAPSKEEALKDFLARKNRQLSILKNRVANVEGAILQVQHLIK